MKAIFNSTFFFENNAHEGAHSHKKPKTNLIICLESTHFSELDYEAFFNNFSPG